MKFSASVLLLHLFATASTAFVLPQSRTVPSTRSTTTQTLPSPLSATLSVGSGDAPAPRKTKKTWKELRKEGGPLTINTPIGALNPFALYYGFVSLLLGLPWLISLKACQLMYWITRGKFDPKRRLPVFFSHVWGVAVLKLTRSYPEWEGLDKLKKFYDSQSGPAMFVANHCSWMDIPFLGATVGWRNYKLVSKKELGIVPILGSAIRAGGNIMVDRSDRKSQLKTLKQGINYLKKEGIHLCTFPEGTRSRTGRLLPFKNGAFKMAHKAGAPVIPLSIVNSHKVMPTGWMFAMKPSYKTAKIVVHDPVPSEGKTEEELAQAVRESMISGLPEEQKPLNG
eukprot:CAMPEP_0176153418 /NCGR_PEP_ID=MMETSP0120_2-20121206/78372_1 /TAXON_ID=160619 /ORGANISM="Kryptoperidinium foliaceum, Strain CCMP 1326" /LENGTH=338 /DNA_ID=CAMNT_0017490477 /DNA_START=129 /DNA_END=1145 /DNA_ORIENTATION=-